MEKAIRQFERATGPEARVEYAVGARRVIDGFVVPDTQRGRRAFSLFMVERSQRRAFFAAMRRHDKHLGDPDEDRRFRVAKAKYEQQMAAVAAGEQKLFGKGGQ